MAFEQIVYQQKKLRLHKSVIDPNFESKTILVNDPWDYVEMWIKRNKFPKEKDLEEALFYWQQARHFFSATEKLPKVSSPLTAYYCFLNATKLLLKIKNISFSEWHGVSGENVNNKIYLSNEQVQFQNSGVLSSLCDYLQEPCNNTNIYSLKSLLYNLPYIHRAYCLTFRSDIELFIPVSNPVFVKKPKKYNCLKSWLCMEIKDKLYTNGHTLNKIANCFERDAGILDKYIIRSKKRFDWDKSDLNKIKRYHQKVRKHLFYIHSPQRLWYLKRSGNMRSLIDRSSLTITFAAMHKLSELARYSPMLLAKHFDSKHNWLLSEFIANAPSQFIDEISSEITGQEFMIPGVKSW